MHTTMIKSQVFKTLLLMLTVSVISNFSFADGSLGAIYKQLGLSEDITYTADMDIQMPAQQNMPAMGPTKVYFKKGAMRTEMEMGGMKLLTILQKDGTLYAYNDMTKSWMKTHLDQAMKNRPLPQYTKVGDETVDGLACTKYTMQDTAQGVTGNIWVFDSMIYKNTIVTPQNTTTICFKNIKKQDLEDALFSLPAGAQTQDINAMMQQAQSTGAAAPQK